ncbi:MAG: AAA family ATPase [Renibacterium salmoninarum]|nr:AAA family ATPase [Renibacterium salmoninarum]
MDDLDQWNRRIIAVCNQKGGVLKTSVVANEAALLAWLGYKVLVVDWDPQANIGLDLGIQQKGQDDDGRGITNSILFGDELVPLKDVRPNLDVIPSGEIAKRIVMHLANELSTKGTRGKGALGRALAPLAPRYDMIIIDCPPGDSILQDEALSVAKWLLLVTKPDLGSRKGLSKMAIRIEHAQDTNPDLEILGTVITDVGSSSTLIREQVRAWLVNLFGNSAPVFTPIVRHLESAALITREQGKVAVEISPALLSMTGDSFEPVTSLDKLAGDYLAIANQIIDVINEAETKAEQLQAGGK